MFFHFLPKVKQHTNGAEYQELLSRFFRGYINRDLETQVKAIKETLTVADFPFMTSLPMVDEASLLAAEVQSEEKELPLAIAHMEQDHAA